jgi:prophage tail gpP-like protein
VGRLEDQDAVSIDSKYVPAENATIDSALFTILKDTPFEPQNKVKKQDAPKGTSSFSVDVGETKLACIQRYLDSLNCICWQDRLGRLVVGRPNMNQQPKGTFILNRQTRKSNVISIKVTRSSTQIPNIYVPVWSGQEQFQSVNPTLVRLENAAYGPNRLRKYGYRTPKAVVSSMPSAGAGQQFTDLNLLTTATAGSSSLIESMAKREMARANVKEITVQVVVPGHFNELGEPYQVDTMYYIDYDRGSLRRVMYCYSVDFSMDENGGQLTTLTFCRPGCIVSDIKAP